MITERRSPGKRVRRRIEIPAANLDKIDSTAGLWADAGDSDSRWSAIVGAAVRRAIATALTEKQREVIEAHFFEGLSQGAIAIRLGITQQVVHKRIYGASRKGRVIGGALQKLREALGPFIVSRSADFLVNRSPGAQPKRAHYEH